MRYTTFINNKKCLEWGLNANQGAMFDLLNQLSSWAETTIIDGEVFYFIARQQVIKELPLFYSRPDTVYRHFKILHEKNLIFYLKKGRKDLIRLTTKGKGWNSDLNPNTEMNPNKLGNESEFNSEMNPTYNNTIKDNITSNNKEAQAQKTEEEKQLIKKIGNKHFGLLSENKKDFPRLPPEKLELFFDWLEYKKGKRQNYTHFKKGLLPLAKKFHGHKVEDIKNALQDAYIGGYSGLFIKTRRNGQTHKNGKLVTAEQQMEALARLRRERM